MVLASSQLASLVFFGVSGFLDGFANMAPTLLPHFCYVLGGCKQSYSVYANGYTLAETSQINTEDQTYSLGNVRLLE